MIRLYYIFLNVIFSPSLYFLGLSRVSFEYRTDHSKRPLVVEMEDIILAKMEIITKTRPKGPLVVSNLFSWCPKLIIKCNTISDKVDKAQEDSLYSIPSPSP